VKLLKSPLRRTTAVLAGAIIGMAGAVAFAAPASATHPTITGTSDCVSEDGWTVTWTVTNKWPVDGKVKKVKVLSPEDGEVTGDLVGEDVVLPKENGGEVTGEQVVPADVEKAKIWVEVKFDNGHKEGKVGVVKRPTEECAPPEEPEEPEEPQKPAEPTPIVEADCDLLIIGLKNPEDGADITLVMKTSKGETRELEVPAGTEKTTKFSASEGFSVEVSAKGLEGSTTVKYEEPEDCGGTGGGDSELPVTGAAAGSIAAGAGVLLAVGGGLFLVARRRKVKFTA
jgi:LPXTG-motif cell wall-anchored protein